MPRDQTDFQSCASLKSSLDIFLFTQTQVNRLCTKLLGWSPKAYDVQEVKPEESTASSKHQSFMNLLLKFCFQCLIPFPATAASPATGQAIPGEEGRNTELPLLLPWLWNICQVFNPDLRQNYRKAERLWSCAAQDTAIIPKELQEEQNLQMWTPAIPTFSSWQTWLFLEEKSTTQHSLQTHRHYLWCLKYQARAHVLI